MNHIARFALGAVAFIILSTGIAFAQDAPAAGAGGGQQCDVEAYKKNVGDSESTSSGGYGAVNSDNGAFGKYQMTRSAMYDMGYVSNASGNSFNLDFTGKSINGQVVDYNTFMGSPDMQEAIYKEYAAKNWMYMNGITLKNGKKITDMVGTTMPDGTKVTQSGLLKASQFGVGTVENYFNANGNCSAPGVRDGNNKCAGTYMQSATGYDVSSLIGEPSDVDPNSCSSTQEEEPYDGDTTSKTCGPTVAMLQAIDCGAYPANLQGFCYRYKPLMMTTAMCNAAERWAENVPPAGPHLESCKTQTFRDGTSSWAYVHACAKAEPAMGAKGKPNSSQQTIGAADDPACYQRLEAAGVEFTQQGKVDISTGGLTCIIPNSLIYRGKEIDFGRELQMNCRLAEQIEEYGRQTKGLGVTGLTDLGTAVCKLKNTQNGTLSSLSTHSTGDAIDVSGFVINGQFRNTSEWWSSASGKMLFEELLRISCTVFDGTLAFEYYGGGYKHMHFQSGETTSCDGRGYRLK